MIRQQRLSPEAWQREVGKMIAWGASVSAPERRDIEKYLATEFGERRTPDGHDGDTSVTAVLNRRCLVCHGAEMIHEQKLSRGSWIREINKMVNWGAILADSDRRELIEYLATYVGPDR
jgi:mono/diheme cytochrome c family protein